jgi:hypothetical protein
MPHELIHLTCSMCGTTLVIRRPRPECDTTPGREPFHHHRFCSYGCRAQFFRDGRHLWTREEQEAHVGKPAPAGPMADGPG